MTVFEGTVLEEAREIISRYPRPRSAIMPLLYLAQSVDGWITHDAMREIGELIDITSAQVEAVASFYTMFRLQPAGKYIVSVCTNVSCKLRGAEAVYRAAYEELGPGCEGVTDDGLITLHEEECLGACEHAPVAQVNWANYENMDADSIRGLISALRADRPPAPVRGEAPQDLRAASRWLAGLDAPAAAAAAATAVSSGGEST